MIKKIAILGSGVMGSAIAAHIASANLKVILLDIALPKQPDRNFLTKKAINSIVEKKLLVNENNINNIEIGNLDDDLCKLSDVDLIIEVIIEDLSLKENLYKKIANYIKDTAIIASNTSTFPLAHLTANLPQVLKQRFFITHFFNPPRHMQLLELIYNQDSDPKKLKLLKKFLDKNLGKTVIICNDTPGFIANRIGCYFLEIALREAIAAQITPEEADNIILPFGLPKTGIFGLWDLIGVDLMPLISASIIKNLPPTDAYCTDATAIEIIEKMTKLDLRGRKSGQGFYKMVKIGTEKTLLSLDFATLSYKPVKTNLPKFKLSEVLSSNEIIHNFVKKIMFKTLAYAASIVPLATKSIYDIDIAMKKGYSLSYGPFELIDKIGTNVLISYLKQHNITIPEILQKFKNQKFYQQDNYLTYNGKYKRIAKEYDYITFDNLKTKQVLLSNECGELIDIGNNVACLVFKNKLGVLNHKALTLIDKTLTYISVSRFNSLVITADGDHFSAGADLKFIYENIKNQKSIKNIEDYIILGQQVMHNIKHAFFPIVIAHKGIALGGGTELILHSDFVCSHIEAQLGLVETKVGLVPGWGGIKEILLKCSSAKNCEKLFLNLITGYKVNNVSTARKDFLFKNISNHMNKDRLISYAKKKSIALAKLKKEKISSLKSFSCNIKKLSKIIENQHFKEHQHYIATEILNIFKYASLNKDILENKINDLERELFLKLVENPKTQARIESFLQNGRIIEN